MHYHPCKPILPMRRLGCYLIVPCIFIGSITAALSAAAGHRYQQVALIKNGGDAPPLVELEYFKADDPKQITSGDAVAYVSGSQEKLLRCSTVRIELLAEQAGVDALRPFPAKGELEWGSGPRFERKHNQPKAERRARREAGDLHCTMWVRKLGTDPYHINDLQTVIDLLRGHDQPGIILTLALRNLGDVDFQGSFKIINLLPDDLAFGSTVAVEEWMDTRPTRLRQGEMPVVSATADSSSKLARQELLRDVIAFQEHLHGQALIYQAKAVSIPPGGAVAVNYIANVSSW